MVEGAKDLELESACFLAEKRVGNQQLLVELPDTFAEYDDQVGDQDVDFPRDC